MKVLLVAAAGDVRKRYRFLLDPLSLIGGVETITIVSNLNYISGVIKSLMLARRHRDADIIIFVGAGPAAIFWYVLNYIFIGAPFVLRLGGAVISEKFFLLRQISGLCLRQRFVLLLTISLNKWLVNHVKSFIIVNNNLEDEIRRYGDKGALVFFIPQYIKPPDHVHNLQDTSDKSINLLTVSNFKYRDKYDGALALMRAVATYADIIDGPRVIKYDLLGGGDYVKSLREEATQITNRRVEINVLGFVDEPGQYYSRADIFLYGSTLDGLPNVVIEAQAYGLPIIINDFPAFRTILTEEENALFFALDDPATVIDALSRLLKNDTLRKNISQKNVEKIHETYSPPAIALKLEGLLDAIAWPKGKS